MKYFCWILVVELTMCLSGIDTRSTVYAEGVSSPSQETHAKKAPKEEGKKSTGTPSSAKWRAKMAELYKILAEVTTDTSSDDRFNSPSNRTRIEKNAKKLADRAHELTAEGLSPDADPTIKMLTGLFQDETKRAYSALKSGKRSYARGILNQVSSYCIACHTRNDSGPSFTSLPLEPIASDLYPIEKGRFYAATRQYDKAMDLFQKIVNDSSAPITRPLEWEQAVRYGLGIAVRVKKDPDQARALVERVIGSKKAPFFIQQDAQKWKDSIIKWKDEPARKAVTEEGLYTEAVQLVSQAREMQKYPADRAADVVYLRASAVIHEMLQKYPDGRRAQEALMLAGICYDVLRPVSLEDLHEIYYEACVRKAPHTSISEACYRRYEQSIYEGFTGSSGTLLPEDVKSKLQALEGMAHPLTEPEQKIH